MFNRSVIDLSAEYAVKKDNLKTQFLNKLNVIIDKASKNLDNIAKAQEVLNTEKKQAEAEKQDALNLFNSIDKDQI